MLDNYEDILDDLYDGIYIVDKNRMILYWNKAAERITGFKAREVIGTSCKDNILNHIDEEGQNLCLRMCPLAYTMEDGKRREALVFLHHKDGHRVPVNIRITCHRDEQGNIIGGIELFTEVLNKQVINDRVRELKSLAMIDNLTKLANRQFIQREISIRFDEMKRTKIPFNIVLFDIDNFRIINHKYSHSIGDKVLKFVANTLVSNSRTFDLFGRWDGDEFIGIIKNAGKNDLAKYCNGLKILIEKSYIMNNEETLSVTVSMGATKVRPEDTIGSIIDRADQLMHQSKEAGRNRLTIE